MKDEFLKIFECSQLNNKTILKILNDLEININIDNIDSISFFKNLESILFTHYKTTLKIDITKKMYSKEEIVGLLVFLYLQKYKKKVSPKLETFLEELFFSKTSENALKEENEGLKEEIKKIKEEKELNINNINVDNVDYEVLKKLEKENIKLKKIIKYENDVVLKAWYNLCEEHIKKMHK